MNAKPNKHPNVFTDLMDTAREFLKFPHPPYVDPDVQNPREVYGHLAGFLGEHLECAPEAALAVVHCLCGERTAVPLSDAPVPCEPILLECSKDCLIQVEVHYLIPTSRKVQRVTAIIFAQGDNGLGGATGDCSIAERRITESLDWSFLPNDVRDAYLRDGATYQSFRVYPPDTVN